MLLEILAYLVEFGIQTVILLAALWVMIKIQKLDYNVLGLIASAVLASALDLIPLAGHFIAVPVLYVCIAKATRADLFPDAVFTVVVAYALMFCANLFLIGALMGDLRLSASEEGFDELTEDMEEAFERERAERPATGTNVTAATNTVVAPMKRDGAQTGALVSKFSLKGISRGSRNSTATIHTGVKTYNLFVGESVSVETTKGKVTVRCEEVRDDSVLLTVDGQSVELFLAARP
jgi:hypothetical protein